MLQQRYFAWLALLDFAALGCLLRAELYNFCFDCLVYTGFQLRSVADFATASASYRPGTLESVHLAYA